MILQIRGTSGSGKTTLVRNLIDHCDITRAVALTENKRKVLVYRGDYGDYPVYLLGDYDESRSAAGCDTIPTMTEIADLAEWYGTKNRGRVILIFEGLLAAHSWGEIGERLHAKFGPRYINAFLDTPMETCYSRVVERRAKRGQDTVGERQEKIRRNVEADYHRVDLCWARVEARGGVRVKIPHKSAFAWAKNYLAAWAKEQR